MELENKNGKDDQKLPESFEFIKEPKINFLDNWHNILNIIFLIIYVALIFVYVHLLKKYNYGKEANAVLYWIVLTTTILFTILFLYKSYKFTTKYINSVYKKGVLNGRSEIQSELEMFKKTSWDIVLIETEKAKKEGIAEGKFLRADIKEIKETIESFKDFFVVEKCFSEENYTKLFNIFKEHPNTWKEFIKRSYPSENGVPNDLWKELTAVLISEHLITLQNLRKSTP